MPNPATSATSPKPSSPRPTVIGLLELSAGPAAPLRLGGGAEAEEKPLQRSPEAL